MAIVRVILAAVAFASLVTGQEPVSFRSQDGAVIYADVYGKGDRGVVLAHGGRFNKESWTKQAVVIAAAGFRVVAIDFRGYGQSRGPGQSDIFTAPLHLDVLAAVRYLRTAGARSISLVGGSLGGGAAADAASEQVRADLREQVARKRNPSRFGKRGGPQPPAHAADPHHVRHSEVGRSARHRLLHVARLPPVFSDFNRVRWSKPAGVVNERVTQERSSEPP
jgi:alpha/beta hydrolase family protein